ncbi:MAG: leucine-rich repeat protein [Clostridia bacterium]|nr:leucine-rich repeat protein [Clostridia bacterium]
MKKVISILTVTFLLFTFMPMISNALVVDDWEIAISNGEATIIGYHGDQRKKIVVPANVGNYNVVAIDGKKLFAEPVEEIVFSEGIRKISGDPFSYNLRYSLKKVVLPESLETLDVSFQGYEKLEKINIPSKITEIKHSQFALCSNLEYIQLNEGLKKIGSTAFMRSGLKELILPSTVSEIGERAYAECHSLVNVIIPDTVTIMGKNEGILMLCENLETVVVGDGVSILSRQEFWGCPNLKSVYLGNSITTIRNGVLSDCTSLKTLVLPNNVETIDYDFCPECISLESVIFPKEIKKITAYNCTLKTRTGFNASEMRKPLPKLFLYGYSDSTTETFSNNEGFPFVDISVATPTNSKVLINGKEVAFTAYNIGGNNYFKLRDIASAINGTNKNFNVGWDGNNNAITLTSNSAYSNVGGELVVNSNAVATEPKISNPKIFVDGKLTIFMAFNIDGNNYIKLRDLGEAFNFGVEWNGTTQTIEINTNKGYSK